LQVAQSIREPFGVSVFGSAVIRVEPDLASLSFGVSWIEKEPQDAFTAAREAAQKVSSFLQSAGIAEVSTSRVELTQAFEYKNNENRSIGYRATIKYHLLLHDLDRMESVLVGVVAAGANIVDAVSLQTSRLKEYRAEARQRAVNAAREKAEIYCQASGVRLGAVIHIEDVNPEIMRSYQGHVMREIQPDDEGEIGALNPGSITVNAAVLMGFGLLHD
jgi:uncharacterized protein